MSQATPLKRLQHHYQRWRELFGSSTFLIKEVRLRLLERLELIKLEPSAILDIITVTDNQSKELLYRYPDATLLSSYLDNPSVMKPRLFWQRWKNREKNIVADPHYLPLPDESIDFIFSNCFFFSSWDVSKLVSEWHRVLSANGLILFSSFGPDTLKEWRTAAARAEAGSAVHEKDRAPAPLIDMHNIGDGLLQQGFSDPVMDREVLTVYYSSFKELCQDLRINNVSAAVPVLQGFRGKKYWQALEANYPRDPATNKFLVTCEIVYGHAWKLKKAPANIPSEVTIPISRIQRAR